jgi:hypothetical protein
MYGSYNLSRKFGVSHFWKIVAQYDKAGDDTYSSILWRCTLHDRRANDGQTANEVVPSVG